MINPDDNKITALYQKIPRQQPSEILDARIKLQARRQLRRGKSIQSYQWLSVAALIVLCVGVVLRVIDEAPVQPTMPELEQQALEMMDEAPDVKTRKKELIQTDAVMGVAVDQKQKVITKPSENMAASRMKIQEMSRPVPSAASPPAFSASMKADMDHEGISSESLHRETGYGLENYCGMDDLRQNKDRLVWEQRIAKLRDEQRLSQLKCLLQLMEQQFDDQ